MNTTHIAVPVAPFVQEAFAIMTDAHPSFQSRYWCSGGDMFVAGIKPNGFKAFLRVCTYLVVDIVFFFAFRCVGGNAF